MKRKIFLVVKPSKISGVGVFTMTPIAKGAFIPVFGNDPSIFVSLKGRRKEEIRLIKNYCIACGKKYECPRNWHHMEIGWYLNHSRKPNALYRQQKNGELVYYAKRNIKAGEEITIDYKVFGERNKNEIMLPKL